MYAVRHYLYTYMCYVRYVHCVVLLVGCNRTPPQSELSLIMFQNSQEDCTTLVSESLLPSLSQMYNYTYCTNAIVNQSVEGLGHLVACWHWHCMFPLHKLFGISACFIPTLAIHTQVLVATKFAFFFSPLLPSFYFSSWILNWLFTFHFHFSSPPQPSPVSGMSGMWPVVQEQQGSKWTHEAPWGLWLDQEGIYIHTLCR